LISSRVCRSKKSKVAGPNKLLPISKGPRPLGGRGNFVDILDMALPVNIGDKYVNQHFGSRFSIAQGGCTGNGSYARESAGKSVR